MTPSEPKLGELRAMSQGDYGTYLGNNDYQMAYVNAVGKTVDTGQTERHAPEATFPVIRWQVDKRDYFGGGLIESRVLGPHHRTFPNPTSWILDGEVVGIDVLSVRLRTRALAIRKMCTPPAQQAWGEQHRLPIVIPWYKVWRIKSFYVSPRDELTWLKVMHRNLYLGGTSTDGDTSCRVCEEKENIIHLVRCTIIRKEFWDPIAATMQSMSMRVPQTPLAREAFWLLGRMDQTQTTGGAQAGIIFLAWRCLYAEIVHTRVDETPMTLKRAYNRVWQMTISRLKAEGERWRHWHKVNVSSGNNS